jgi:antitoxin component YwqK of YwqJK toxin-antitoxin module
MLSTKRLFVCVISVFCIAGCSESIPERCEEKFPVFTAHVEVSKDGERKKVVDSVANGSRWVCTSAGRWLRVTPYVDGKKNGAEIEWHSTGHRKTQLNYKNGQYDGESISWYPNGSKAMEIDFKEGQRHGDIVRWHKNGQISLEGEYENDEEHGLHEGWYENGQISSKGRYENGEKLGLHEKMFGDGKPKERGEYIKGYPVGRHTKWDSIGLIQEIVVFTDVIGKKRPSYPKNRVMAISWGQDGDVTNARKGQKRMPQPEVQRLTMERDAEYMKNYGDEER